MISAIVLAPDILCTRANAAELVARSLPWLVSAVVAGVIRDVTLAAAPALDLADLADHVGCDIIQSDDEAMRYRASVAKARCAQVLILEAGFQPAGSLAEELDARSRLSTSQTALLLAGPSNLAQRLMPKRAPIVGIFAPKDIALKAGSVEDLARACRRGPYLETRVRPLV